MLQTWGGRLLSIEIPSDVTFVQRRGWADNTLWVDNTYFTVYSPFLSLYTHLSLALSRFISVELHGVESFVAQKFQHVCKFKMHVYLRFRLFNLKFRYMAANRHTHTSCNVVTLVWGSLRLTPIMKIISSHTLKIWSLGGFHQFLDMFAGRL